LTFLLAAIILQKLSCHSCQQLKDSRLGTTSRLQSCRFCSALLYQSTHNVLPKAASLQPTD
jgi:hypothetical protein